MNRLLVVVSVALTLAACGGGTGSGTNPYDTYKAHAPTGEPVLSREDAQTRALLGCSKKWAPGTVDRALADAYRPTGICD